MYVLTCYLSYLAISIGLTVWVARTLHKSGRVFLVDAFHGNTELADSVNHLLVVGFYLINVGYIAVALKTTEALTTSREVIELESGKVGVVSWNRPVPATYFQPPAAPAQAQPELVIAP